CVNTHNDSDEQINMHKRQYKIRPSNTIVHSRDHDTKLNIKHQEQETLSQLESNYISTVLAMTSPDKIEAIVLTCDRYRAITQHLIFQYHRLWPDHPFVFHIPYQELGGVDSERIRYHTCPADIKLTVLHLLADIDDEEWIYWCVDHKYPIQIVTNTISTLISHAMRSPELDGLLVV